MSITATDCAEGSLDLQPTIRLHDWLCDRAAQDCPEVSEVCREIRQTVHRRSIWFERQRELPLALSAVVLTEADIGHLRSLSERLHGLIELALDWTLDDPQRLSRFFPDHRRIAPYFRRTPGLDFWQGYSRYDAVITADGTVRFIEANTCCPAGFLHAPDASEILLQSFSQLEMPWAAGRWRIGTLERDILVDRLLSLERRGAPNRKGVIALLNDENSLTNEVEMLRTALERRGRDVVVAGADELERCGRSVCWRDRPISLSWNKIRVSTPDSPNHCWKTGFEQRYAAFLSGLRDQAFVSVNNLVAATLAEDKGLLALFYHPEFRQQLDAHQKAFIDRHVLWTARLENGAVDYQGRTIDLLPFVRQHRERFVIKPANEGRGFGVLVGKFCDQQQWQQACQPNATLPCVVQQYAPPLTLPVLTEVDSPVRKLCVRSMQLTLAMGMIEGTYRGLFSRVASGPVTNVGKAGMLQAVFIDQRQ
ncbi:hypothetical protein [Roseimaritima sediminicola]|uniref:hypothetical protein n=1 Tax=Roseimaritima sediminicola TaxID=2662066 RepID=UPI0012983529|nr:hypothetical protein [Roseimaritima sediminicola]